MHFFSKSRARKSRRERERERETIERVRANAYHAPKRNDGLDGSAKVSAKVAMFVCLCLI